jgi:hypothetical protein
MTRTIFIARQPILDRGGQTFGYELLYRDGLEGESTFDDPDDAAREVMERVLLHWGMERIIEDHFGLINASPSLVVSGLHRSMPPEGIIFEIVEVEPLDGPTHSGPLGRTLEIVLACERADIARLAELVPAGVDVQAAYDEAINWADQLGSQLPRERTRRRLNGGTLPAQASV